MMIDDGYRATAKAFQGCIFADDTPWTRRLLNISTADGTPSIP